MYTFLGASDDYRRRLDITDVLDMYCTFRYTATYCARVLSVSDEVTCLRIFVTPLMPVLLLFIAVALFSSNVVRINHLESLICVWPCIIYVGK